MTLKPHYLYVILLVLLSIYFIYKYNSKPKAESIEGYKNLNLPSFDEFMKYSQGYKCDENLDTLPYELKSQYEMKSFCDEYPNVPTLEKLSTNFIDKPLLINKKSIRKFTTDDINVNINTTGEMNKDNSNMILSSVPKKANLGHFNLMQDECVDKCKESDLCEYAISANKGDPYMGTCYLFNRKLDLSKVKSGSSGATNTLFSKINTVEYSIGMWIKIDKVNKTWRNIIHVGDKNVERFPGLWIIPNNFGIHASLSTKGRGEKPGAWGNTEGMYAFNTLQPKKWHHLTFTLNGKHAKIFVDGKMVAEKKLGGAAQWPGTKKSIYISDPWHSTGDFTLSKMNWYPFALSDAFVKNLALSTFPLEKFKKSVNVGSAKMDPEKIVLTNGWVSVNESGKESGKVAIKDVGDVAFIDGIVKGGAPNTVMGFLPQDKIPDRHIWMPVAGENGRYLLHFNPNGNLELYDNSWGAWMRDFGRNTKDTLVFITARFPFSKGAPLKTSNGYWITNPGYRPKGSIVYLSGGIKYGSVSIPDSLRPSKSDLYGAMSAWMPARVDVRNNGSTFNVFGRGYTSLEGVHYSRFNGERLRLESGFRNYSGDNGYWSYAQVVLDSGIVLLRGLVVRGNFLKKNLKSSKAEDENMYSSSPAGDGQWKRVGTNNKKQCEELAEKTGNKYYKLDPSCHLATRYNTIKPSWSQFSKDMAKLPGMIPAGDKITFTKDNSIVKNLSSNATDIKGKSLIPFYFNKNGSFYIKSSDFNKKTFKWQMFYEAAKLYKVTQVTKKSDNESYVAITPVDIMKWTPQIPSSLGGMSYLAPPKNDTRNPFIVLDSNTKYSNTTRTIDKTRFIDFTSKAHELRDGEYELRQYSKHGEILERLVTFEKRMGEYIEYSNTLKQKNTTEVYQVDLREELITRLPMKYRPLENHFFMSNAHNGFAIIKIDTNGNVILKGHLGTSWRGFSLAGISYVVDPIKANRREYKYAFRGECGGPEILKYAGSKQTTGTWDEKVDRCAKACEDEKDVKGFIVYPSGSSAGRCWCEKQHDATCKRHNSAYKRYTFTDAPRGRLVKISIKNVISWSDADSLAKKNNGRLPTKEELRDGAINRENVQITNVSGLARQDFWHPVSRPDGKKGDWTQIGNHYNGRHGCKKYCSHFDTFGKTNWGDRRNWTFYRPTGYKNRDFIYIMQG